MISKIIEEFLADDRQITIPEHLTKNLVNLHKNFDTEELFRTQDDEFIDQVMMLFPEAHFMNGEANETAEGAGSNVIPKDSPSVRLYGKYSLEADRAIAGVLNLKLAYDGSKEAYEKFTRYQNPASKLKFESFISMHKYIRALLITPEDMKAALWSIICNDLGKIYNLIRIHETAYPNFPSDYSAHDLILGKLLSERPELFPGFMLLSEEHKHDIAAAFSSGFEFSQYVQLQLPTVLLDKFIQLSQKAIDFYALHSIFDISGAAAKIVKPGESEPGFIEGSLPMDEATWQSCSLARNSFNLLRNKTVTCHEIYNNYLKARGELLGVDSSSPKGAAIIRIAGMGRLFGKEDGKRLLAVWSSLPEDIQKTLEKELNISGDQEKAIFAALYPAVLSNAQNTVKRLFRAKAQKEGKQVQENELLTVGNEAIKAALIMLVEVYVQSRSEIKDNSGGIYISDFSAIAKRWGVENPLKDIELIQKGSLNIIIKPKPNADYGLEFALIEQEIKPALELPAKQAGTASINRGSKTSELANLGKQMDFCFQYRAQDLIAVYLAGTFNNWLGAREGKINLKYDKLNEWIMDKNKEENWSLTKELKTGVHEFKYVIKAGDEFKWKVDEKYPISPQGNSWFNLQ